MAEQTKEKGFEIACNQQRTLPLWNSFHDTGQADKNPRSIFNAVRGDLF